MNKVFRVFKNLRYKTAIYARLSIKDIDKNTINNQINILKDFISKNKDMELVKIFCDNGFSGRNFLRDDFQKMIFEVYHKNINCIVVKDFSRFGRNFIETCNYLENIFPLEKVRFISLDDNYDSKRDGNINIIMAFKNLLNEFYIKDISLKSKSSLEIKQNEGKYLGGRTPYGYLRDKKNKYALVVDDESAKVVKKIFELKLCGFSKLKISKYLNDLAIPSPEKYRYNMKNKNSKFLWSDKTIDLILKNPVYIGNIIYKKSQNVEQKKIYAGHEKIIDVDVFYEVQKNN